MAGAAGAAGVPGKVGAGGSSVTGTGWPSTLTRGIGTAPTPGVVPPGTAGSAAPGVAALAAAPPGTVAAAVRAGKAPLRGARADSPRATSTQPAGLHRATRPCSTSSTTCSPCSSVRYSVPRTPMVTVRTRSS